MKSLIGRLFIAALCLAGCAVDPGDAADTHESTASQAVSTGIRCSNKTWRVNFYSDATFTTQVGSASCVCFAFENQDGIQTAFSRLVNQFTCSLQ